MKAPDIDCHFNFGLAHKNDIFSCLAEVLILSFNWQENCNIDWVNNWDVKRIFEMKKEFNFQLGDFQNFYKLITKEDIERIKKIRSK